ncbi:hypothetical protein AAY473_029595 [Plecturocebus cupreus]
MAPPARLARSLGLGADPPGRAPPAGSRRPTALTPEGAPSTQRVGSPAEVAAEVWTAEACGSSTGRCSFDHNG